MLGIHASPFQFVCDLPRIWSAEPMRPGHTYEGTPKRAWVRSVDGHMRYMIDGDLHETRGELEVSIGPRVRIVVNL
jgi:hypothetical protein